MDDSEQLLLQGFSILYLVSSDDRLEQAATLDVPADTDLLIVRSADEGIKRLRGRRVLAILFDLDGDAAEWEALAHEYAAPDEDAPIPFLCICDSLPDAERLKHFAALGVVDLIHGETCRDILCFKLCGMMRQRRQLERVGRLARGLVESEAKLEILVHQQTAANLQLQTEGQQRRRALAALAISESRLRSLVEAGGDCVWEVDTDARYTYASATMEKVLGIAAEDVIGKSMSQLLPKAVATRIHRAFVELLRNSEPFIRFENPVPAGDRRPRMLETSVVPVYGDEQAIVGFRGVDRDITERKEQEAELEKARRAEAIGQITGGITHDLNNLLTIVLGNLRLIGRDIDKEKPEILELIEDTESAAGEAVDLVRQLSGKSGRQPLQRDNVDLNAQVADTTRRIRRNLGAGIECLVELSPNRPIVAVDASRLHNALLNLALNARDAMEGEGRLMIETLTSTVDADSVPEGTRLAPGDYAMVRVMDTGAGMTPDVLSRATEPFFTTKEAGKGSGMGLSMVFGTVVKAGGCMRLESQPGEGTSVTLWLPRQATDRVADRVPAEPAETSSSTVQLSLPSQASDGSRPAPASAVDLPVELPRGTETLLVADDDARIRRLTVRFLEELGYKVLEVADGSDAKAILESDVGAEIDLVFTDIVMPGDLDGVALAMWVREHRPQTRVLLSSGFGNDGDGHGMDTADLPFLPKPFAQRALAIAVRQVLEQPADALMRARIGVTEHPGTGR